MNASLLNHLQGVKDYTFSGSVYKDKRLFLNLFYNPKGFCHCPNCRSRKLIKYGKVHRDIRALPVGSTPTILHLTLQRYQCKKCHHVFLSRIPFTNGEASHTKKFQAYVLDLLRLGLTISAVARHLRINWHVVKDIHKAHLHKHYRNPNLKGLRCIGIDEFAVHKGQIYKTIVVDHETGRIVYVGNGRSKEALAKFWRRVKRLKVKIEVVSSDLSAAFISSVGQNAPDAIHVYDKFHIVQLVAQAIDKTRRSVYKQTTDMEQRKIIKGNRWILLRKDPEKLDKKYKKRLDNILETNKPLATAYYLYEDIDQIWMQKNKEEALGQLEYWCRQAQESKLYYFKKVAASLMARRTGISVWYDYQISNAGVEGINNKIKMIKRRAYGFRDEKYFELILLGLYDENNAIIR